MKIKLLILLSLTLATVTIGFNGFAPDQAGLVVWAGTINLTKVSESGRYRLLIEEFEYVSANFALHEGRTAQAPYLDFCGKIRLGRRAD